MKSFHRHALLALCCCACAPLTLPAGTTNTSVHTTWLWHLHQPVYWPDRAPANHSADHYQNAWDTIQLGNAHPSDTSLSTVFGASDRVNAYQGEPNSVVNNLKNNYANAGAQVNYSGALMENVQSLASAPNGSGGYGQLGYSPHWNDANANARAWTTSAGKPRMDLLNFTYHHALGPLLSDETLEMELRIHQRQMEIFWGGGSRGYFPTETCFSERMIPVLNRLGIAWTVVANNHLARTCPDMPVVTGSGGEMCDLPNAADQINPAQGAGNFQRAQIDRGCSPTQVMPFGFQLHYARHVDPNTGAESKIILAPSDQVFGWKDSYSTWDLGLVAPLAARNNPAKPALVLCAHDGDNAWSGGSSYYNEWVPQMAGGAASRGYEPTTVEQFINDFPPATNDIVHVEDGGWVFADSDFGSPSFINWNWPPSYAGSSGNVVDPSIGVTDKGDNWRVIIATENRVKTAQQISGLTNRVDQVRDPGSYSTTPNSVELGWHYYLAGLDSGFVYYGCTADECLRAIVAQSNSCRNVDSLLSNPASDATPPTVFLPQRHPWNPGGTNFGVQYGYKTVVAANSDFWIWTYAYDVSGISNVTLHVRGDGTNPPTSDQFKTYAGGTGAGVWQATNMTRRVAGDSSGYTPQYLADYYYVKVAGISNAFVDYYVSATDAHSNTYKSPIQHVYVGAGSGGGGGNTGSSGPVSVTPTNPVAGNPVTIQYVAAGRNLSAAANIYIHLGWNNWNPTLNPDPAMTFNAASNWWQYTATNPPNATNLNCVFNDGHNNWDNNSSANWNFAVIGGTNSPVTNVPSFLLDGSFDSAGYLIASNGLPLYAAVRGSTLYVATQSPGNSGANDVFIFVTDQLLASAAAAAPWAKAGTVATSVSKPFLAAESQGSYVSWFANNAATNWPASKSSTTSGALEGTLNLASAFGYVPTNIFLCAAACQTADGGALAAQCPAGSGPNIDTNEFLMLPVAALRDSLGNGTFDLCDPARGFTLLSATARGTNRVLNFAVMPGRNYQVEFANGLNGVWTNLPPTNYAAPPLMNFNFTDAPPAGTPQRFYRIKLLP
jgi:hypothetical protein